MLSDFVDSLEPVLMSQRRWMRFPSDVSTVAIHSHGNPVGQADVVDESFAGIALDLDDIGGLVPEQRIEINFRGEPRRCVVRYMVPMANGRYRLGLEWLNSAGTALLLRA